MALETVDLDKDPYFSKNCHGSFECKLCLTLHPNEGNYLAHTQAKKHQTNMRRRAAREQKQNAFDGSGPVVVSTKSTRKVATFNKIGRPGYRVTKQYDPETSQRGLLFQINYPNIEKGMQPRHRFLSAFAQRVEAPDPAFQYLLFAARPYETIAFKIPALQVERDMLSPKYKDKIFFDWDRERKVFSLQILFKDTEEVANE
jgi:splicing factor 3A subunit 2